MVDQQQLGRSERDGHCRYFKIRDETLDDLMGLKALTFWPVSVLIVKGI
jgi:hypothetical protein